jgi:hypothetical protein
MDGFHKDTGIKTIKGEKMMEEIYALVVKKTGISHDQAKLAVDTVVDFLKTKLPAPVAAQVENALSGKGDLGAAADMIGGLFGGKK